MQSYRPFPEQAKQIDKEADFIVVSNT